MCIPGLREDAAAGTDPARLAVPRNATSPGNVTCAPWGQQLSLHPLSPGMGSRSSPGAQISPAGRGPCGAPHPPRGPFQPGARGRAGPGVPRAAQGPPAPGETQDGGKASNSAEGSARRSPLWIRNCVMASDPRKRGCPLPSVSPARPRRLEGGAAGTGWGRGGSVAPLAAPRGFMELKGEGGGSLLHPQPDPLNWGEGEGGGEAGEGPRGSGSGAGSTRRSPARWWE